MQYERRRVALIADLTAKIEWADERIRFINFYLNNVDLFKNTGKKELLECLEQNKFTQLEKLLSMPIWSLTKDRIKELEDDVAKLRNDLASIKNDTGANMFNRELKAFKPY